jgi:hypothetical protein
VGKAAERAAVHNERAGSLVAHEEVVTPQFAGVEGVRAGGC